MMDPEDLRSELLSLRRLYGLLVNEQQRVSKKLDKNARQLLLNLLDARAKKAFEAHAKMVGTQYRPSYYNLWSTTQFPSLQNLDLRTSQGIFNEPISQEFSSDEPDVNPKRCRVCQRPKVKQLTKELSQVQDNQCQNHKRSWEDQNNPTTYEVGVGGFPCSSTVDFPKSPTLYNQNDEDDQISRQAYVKIQQIESCISTLQLASNRVMSR
ncbi:hypothetical protein Lser_V15G36498 [Lactuca serriola]